jgi:predicted RNase H-like HicB family nuclease
MNCVILKTGMGYLAYIKEAPNCARTSASLEDVVRLAREALCLHFQENPGDIPLTFISRDPCWSAVASVPIEFI